LLGVKLFPAWPDGFFNAIFQSQRTEEYLFLTAAPSFRIKKRFQTEERFFWKRGMYQLYISPQKSEESARFIKVRYCAKIEEGC
jgi:hypothetical protein